VLEVGEVFIVCSWADNSWCRGWSAITCVSCWGFSFLLFAVAAVLHIGQLLVLYFCACYACVRGLGDS